MPKTLKEKEEIIKNEKGCPCSGDCCNNPDIFHPYEVGEDGEYILECRNCGDTCNHEE